MPELYKFAKKELQAAAVPAFLRIQKQYGEMTGTMKFMKKEYVETGFNPDKTQDLLFFRDDAQGTYIPLDGSLFKNIAEGKMKF